MRTIHYPVKGRNFENTYTQELLEQLAHKFENWLQGPGVVGSLHLHGCWGKTGVLDKRYGGETVTEYYCTMPAAIRLYEATKDEKWRILAHDMASNVLFLQEPDGGFRHGSAEFEPTFTSGSTCPIHQSRGVMSLLFYADWKGAEPYIKNRIRPALDRHWDWMMRYLWKRGNGGHHPYPYNAGFCGVTNQDLMAVLMISEYSRVFGDTERYEKYGKPCLDDYLTHYYYPEMGLFERGDGNNFVERTPYYGVILEALAGIYKNTGDARIPEVMDNITAHLFDAAFVDDNGFTFLAWGAKTDPVDKSHVVEWIRTPTSFNYNMHLPYMADYLRRHPDEKKQAIYDALEETFCGYIFCDGSFPRALHAQNPIFALTFQPDFDGLILHVMDYLGDRIRPLATPEDLCIHRKTLDYVWKQKGKLWSIEKGGVRQYGGYSAYTGGITIGPDEPAYHGSYDSLDACDVEEIVG